MFNVQMYENDVVFLREQRTVNSRKIKRNQIMCHVPVQTHDA